MKTPKSLQELLSFYGIYPNSGDCYYRGQADYSWDIIPSLARNMRIKNIDDIIRIERKLFEKFRKKIKDNKLDNLIPKAKNSYDESWILLMTAQHHGLPTRFLDFSNDIFTALEFAVADIQNLHKDGALIIYGNNDSVQKDFSIFRCPFSNNHNTSFFLPVPSIYNPYKNEGNLNYQREIIQGSKFLYRDTPNLCKCLSSDKLHSERLTKICIPREFKLDIINYLMKVERMAYDLFAGKNELDYYSAILKLEFSKLDESKIEEYIKSD